MLGKCTMFFIPQRNHANEGGRLQSKQSQRVALRLKNQLEGDHVDLAVLITPNEYENDEDDVGLEDTNIEGDHDERSSMPPKDKGLRKDCRRRYRTYVVDGAT
ncbi:hypothetical protein MTR_7g032460 [Medicago truncatula]|uniref:Uncharacterized protein n=1 Tax=Medicago truncatula TaxID=3880 RepID=G7L5E1_MEDTR|nr:hypothetical protein MTR_7g032460 [Medicago truncatula]